MPKRKTVLIVEDYADARRFLKCLVESRGYKVVEACDGYEAVEKASEFYPDLILMDLALPVMDGVSATTVIRKFDSFGRVPIIAITAHGEDYHKIAIEAGCDRVVRKPVDMPSLEPLLEQYLPFGAKN